MMANVEEEVATKIITIKEVVDISSMAIVEEAEEIIQDLRMTGIELNK